MVYTVRDIHTLDVKMSSKINWLVAHTSPGALVLQQWLTENGVSYSLAQKYAQNGWLKKLSSGVYYRPNAQGDIKQLGLMPFKHWMCNWAFQFIWLD